MSLNEIKPINCSDFVFLLGGQDLEMVEIKKILESLGMTFFDHKLHWGAKLSDYSNRFDDIHTFLGIELIKDISPPKHYIDIDHHNEKVGLPSSIEQVAELLGISLTHHQRLVAANDKGYIPAMEALGASREEIMKIRELDRESQGITDEDECLAEQTIGQCATKHADVLIIESLTPKFSPVTDRLYPYEKLLIIHKDKLVYYGKEVSLLVHHFKPMIDQHQAYYGGGENGFFGIASAHFSNSDIQSYFKPEILKIVSNG